MDIQLRKDLGHSNNSIAESVMTERELSNALRVSRQQKGGLSLQEVADIIKEEFDESEVEALINNLKL